MLQQLAPARAGPDRTGPDGAPVSGAYGVDISRGERIGRVSSEWFTRALQNAITYTLCHAA